MYSSIIPFSGNQPEWMQSTLFAHWDVFLQCKYSIVKKALWLFNLYVLAEYLTNVRIQKDMANGYG